MATHPEASASRRAEPGATFLKTTGQSAPPAWRACRSWRPAPAAAAPPAGGSESSGLTFGSGSSDEVPKKAYQAVTDAFTKKTGKNGRHQRGAAQRLPEQDQLLPAGQPGRHLHLVRRLPDAVLRRQGPPGTDRRRLGQDRRQLLRRPEEGLHRPGRQDVLRPELQLPVGFLLPEEPLGRTRATRCRTPSTRSRPWPPR